LSDTRQADIDEGHMLLLPLRQASAASHYAEMPHAIVTLSPPPLR
jgi:hypothetical protein